MSMFPIGTQNFIANMTPGHAYYLFDGDLCQMGNIEQSLRAAGFKVVRSESGTYPGFPEDQLDVYKRALKYVYDHQIDGWWSQRHKLLQHQICTEEEFQAKINKIV